MAITLDIPTTIEQQLEARWGGEMPRRVLEAVAIEGYRQEILSRREVGELLGLDLWQTEAFLKDHGVPLPYSLEDLDADLRSNADVARP